MNGQTDAALEAARKAAEMQKDSPRFQSRVGWILYHAKRNDEAKKAYQSLVDQFDKTYDSSEIRDVLREARLVLSNICVLQNNLPESEEWLEQVLDEFPEDVGAFNDLGYLWADQNKHLARALKMTKKAVDAEPENMAYRDSLGWAYYRLGRYGEAIAELKIAASVDEPDGVIYDHLADALAKHGEKAAAIENWTKAVAAFEKSMDSEKIPAVKAKIAAAKN
jgi:tetratricopeptide (TPR) repeat protein